MVLSCQRRNDLSNYYNYVDLSAQNLFVILFTSIITIHFLVFCSLITFRFSKEFASNFAFKMSQRKKIQFGKISVNFAKNAATVEVTGSITKLDAAPNVAIQNESVEIDREHEEMQKVLGISSFGKKAKSFDVKVRSFNFYNYF